MTESIGARSSGAGWAGMGAPTSWCKLIARQKGLSHPAIDAQVALVDARLDARLEANRKEAAVA